MKIYKFSERRIRFLGDSLEGPEKDVCLVLECGGPVHRDVDAEEVALVLNWLQLRALLARGKAALAQRECELMDEALSGDVEFALAEARKRAEPPTIVRAVRPE